MGDRVPTAAPSASPGASTPALGSRFADQPLTALFDQAAERWGERAFLSSRTLAQESWSFRSFAADARRLAQALVARGVRPGDAVVLLCENRPRWCVGYAAISYAGGVVVSLDAQLGPAGVADVVRDSGARSALVSRTLEERLSAAEERGDLERVLGLDDDMRAHAGWSELLGSAGSARLPGVVGGDARAAILYTSGTTGKPKGVVLTHANVQSERAAVEQAVELTGADRMLMFLPMHHVLSQLGAFLMPAAFGLPVVHVDVTRAEDLLDAVRDEGVTILLAVPLLYHRIHARIDERVGSLAAPARLLVRALLRLNGALRSALGVNLGPRLFRSAHALFGPQLRLMVSGASALEPRVQRDLFRLGFTVAQGYGLTESTGAATFTPLDAIVIGTVGRPVAGLAVRIADPDEEGLGEICLRGPMITPGYHGRPDETAAVLDADGWLHTGDVGRLGADGNLRISGRVKEMIVLESGKNVYPEDLETHYAHGASIAELCVLEKTTRDGRILLHAVVVPDWERLRAAGVSSVREQVRGDVLWCSAELPAWQRVLSFELRREPLPRTATRKLQRFKVLEELAGAAEEGEPAAPDPPEVAARLASPSGRTVARIARERAHTDGEIRGSMHLELDLGLDSLRRMELLLAIEQALGFSIGDEEAAKLETVDDVLRLAEERGARAQDAGGDGASAFARLVAEAGPSDLPPWMRKPRGATSALALRVVQLELLAVAKLYFRLRVEGLEHLPPRGPFLICPNHQSYADSFLVAAVLPPAVARDAFALGHSRYVGRGIGGLVGRFFSTVPTDPDRFLRQSMEIGAAGLKAGRPLLIFPEGTRTVDGGLHAIRSGAAILAVELGVPIVPAAIDGAFESWPRSRRFPRPGRVRLTFGAPIVPARVVPPAAAGEGPEAPAERVRTALRDALLALGVPEGAESRA